MVAAEVVPGPAVCAVVFTDGDPGAHDDVGSPALLEKPPKRSRVRQSFSALRGVIVKRTGGLCGLKNNGLAEARRGLPTISTKHGHLYYVSNLVFPFFLLPLPRERKECPEKGM